jgi:hypothetical protein
MRAGRLRRRSGRRRLDGDRIGAAPGSSGPRVAQAISGEAQKAVTSAISAEKACASAPNAPRCAATDSSDAMPIAPTPTGLMS